MPGCFLQVPGGVVSFEAYYPQTMPKPCLEDTVIWDRRWCYQRRSPDTVPQWDQTFISTGAWWPMIRSGGFGGDPTNPVFFSDDTLGFSCGAFAAWEYGLGGSQSRKFITGKTKNASGDAIVGAVVQGFRTSDDMYIGETASNDKGIYELGCPNTPTDQHYLVAYYASGNLAGTTVNTLVPKWRDGTV